MPSRKHRQRFGHLADLIAAALGADFRGEIARREPRHGAFETDEPRHQIAADIEPDEQGRAGDAHGRDHQHHEGAEVDSVICAIGRALGPADHGLDLACDLLGQFIGEAARFVEQLSRLLGCGEFLAARIENAVVRAALQPGFGGFTQALGRLQRLDDVQLLLKPS